MEEKIVIHYEKKNRPSLKGCYVKRDRKVYPVGTVWHPFVQPFGYMKCHACTCMVSGGSAYNKRAHEEFVLRVFLSQAPAKLSSIFVQHRVCNTQGLVAKRANNV